MRCAQAAPGFPFATRSATEPDLSRHVPFLCSRNRLRSPTAGEVFRTWPGVGVESAGLSPDADNRVTPELLAWADDIFVMEPIHRTRLTQAFGPWLRGKRVVCLRIPDDFGFMDPKLVSLLRARVAPHLPGR